MTNSYSNWCKEKVNMSPEFEAGFEAGYKYANVFQTRKPKKCSCSKYYTCAGCKSGVTTVANLEQYNSTQFAGLMQPGQRSNLNDYIDQQNIAQQTDR